MPNPSRYEFGGVVKSEASIELSAGGARAARAPGNPQAMFAVDSMVDELAAAAGKDPIAYRKLIDPSDVRHKMYDAGLERIGWKSRPKPDGSGEGRIRRGVGVGEHRGGAGGRHPARGLHRRRRIPPLAGRRGARSRRPLGAPAARFTGCRLGACRRVKADALTLKARCQNYARVGRVLLFRPAWRRVRKDPAYSQRNSATRFKAHTIS